MNPDISEHPGQQQKLRKIMIIDDEPDIRLYLAAAIEDSGFEPIIPDADQSAMQLIADTRPDLVVMDIMMPGRSGISIYKEIRTSPALRHIPIILISGMAGASEFMEKGFREMAGDSRIPPPEGFIEKPINIELLIQHITRLLDRSSP